MKATSTLVVLTAGAALASCSVGAGYSGSTAQSQVQLARELEGRIAGPPQRCLSGYRTTNMTVIDDSTLLYRDGRTTYLQRLRGSCYGIGSGATTLVTKQFGTNQYCDGDIARSVDLRSGMTNGSCAFGPFIPYTKPR